MKQAVLDIGTNSVRLLVAETVADETTTLRKDIRATRLGDGLAAGEPLNEAAKNRTLTGIQELVDEAREAGVERWSIVGTNALREARLSSSVRRYVLSVASTKRVTATWARSRRTVW